MLFGHYAAKPTTHMTHMCRISSTTTYPKFRTLPLRVRPQWNEPNPPEGFFWAIGDCAWPGNSPDLHFVGNFNAFPKDQVEMTECRSLTALKEACIKVWNSRYSEHIRFHASLTSGCFQGQGRQPKLLKGVLFVQFGVGFQMMYWAFFVLSEFWRGASICNTMLFV